MTILGLGSLSPKSISQRLFSSRSIRITASGLVVLSIAAFVVGRAGMLAAQDTPAPRSEEGREAGSKAPLKVADIPASTFVVPEKASIPDLLEFIAKIERLKPEFDSEEQAVKYFTTSRTATLAAAERILAGRPTEKQEVQALKTKLQSYQFLLMVGVPDMSAKALKFAEELKHDKRPQLAEAGEAAWLDFKMAAIPTLEPKDRRAVIEAVGVSLRKKPQNFFELAEGLGRLLEALGDGENAAFAYATFGEILSQNLNQDFRNAGEKMKTGAVRRARLLAGDPVKVSGTTVEGKPFDISEYKGKVVIVDFWATWCGPCLAELPNLKSIYQKYHRRGLEVVGISLDDDGQELGKFLKDNDLPWKILHTTGEKKGFSDPNVEFYGITGIPTIFLINRSGKVISLMARGEQLATLVDGLIGSPGTFRK